MGQYDKDRNVPIANLNGANQKGSDRKTFEENIENLPELLKDNIF